MSDTLQIANAAFLHYILQSERSDHAILSPRSGVSWQSLSADRAGEIQSYHLIQAPTPFFWAGLNNLIWLLGADPFIGNTSNQTVPLEKWASEGVATMPPRPNC